MALNDNLKNIRKIRGLTQKELAQKSGITRESIGNYERGDRIPPVDTLNKIAKALGVTPNDLIGPKRITGIQELIQNILNEKRAENIEDISEKANIELNKIKLFQNGSNYTPDDYNKIVNTFYGSYYNYMNQSPQLMGRVSREHTECNKALDSLYIALKYYYGNDIEKNLQREIFIDLNIGDKEIFYTKNEFKKFLEYVSLSFPNFKYIIDKLKSK